MNRVIAAAIWLASVASVAGASAEPPNVTLQLTPAEVVAIVLLVDHQPMSEPSTAGFWNAQAKILAALKENPEAWRTVRAALERHYSVR
jgi:hypothetical protein